LHQRRPYIAEGRDDQRRTEVRLGTTQPGIRSGRIEGGGPGPIDRRPLEKEQVMAEATAKVKTTTKPVSQGSTFEAKVETPKFELPKFPLPKFDVPKMEVPAAFRELAERGVAQARDGYEKMKAAAEETTDVLEDTYANASKGATDYTLKTIEIARANTNAAFDFAVELAGVKSFSEAVELASSYTRHQFDALLAQSKELTALAQKVAADTSEPLKSGVNRAFKIAA
jgi:phasin